MNEEIFNQLREGICFFEDEKAKSLAEKIVEMVIDSMEVLEEGSARPQCNVGRRFKTGEAFINELIASAKVM